MPSMATVLNNNIENCHKKNDGRAPDRMEGAESLISNFFTVGDVLL